MTKLGDLTVVECAYRSSTTYKVATAVGELTNINKYVIVAPEIVIREQIRLIMQEAR